MKALSDLYKELVNMYSYEVEMSGALHQWNEFLKKTTKGSKSPKVFVGRDDPNSPNATFQYVKPAAELISSSAKNGAHETTLRRSVIALTYSLWEDQYRQRIAYECRLGHKNRIKSDVFRDVNRYRQAVLHAGGRLIGKPTVINFFKQGEEVLLTDDHMYQLFSILMNELNRIGKVYYKQDPRFSLNLPLYNQGTSPHPSD